MQSQTTADAADRLDMPVSHPTADRLDFMIRPLDAEDCSVCGSAPACCRAPALVNGRVYLHDAVCHRCGIRDIPTLLDDLHAQHDTGIANAIERVQFAMDYEVRDLETVIAETRNGRTIATIIAKYG